VSLILARIAAVFSAGADLVGRVVFAPLANVPGWLSATVVAAVSGVLLLIAFKFTSNQGAIKSVRDDLDANLLALKLFKDSTSVTLKSQGRMMVGAFRLMLLAVVPILLMAIPVVLLLGQLGLWFERRPLRVNEETVLTLALSGDAQAPWPEARLWPTDGVSIEAGPVRVRTKREVCWKIKGKSPGLQHLRFDIDGRSVDKELAIGDGFMRVSSLRPGWNWEEIMLNPAEAPFRPNSPVRSIAVDFPERLSWTSGTNSWLIYWFVVSMLSALLFRRAFNVKV
jgi:hypothetical protein